MFCIWIGNRLPQGIDLNTLDIQHYMSSGSCVIEATNSIVGIPSEIKRVANKFGGTVLLFTHLEGMTIQEYRAHGTSNSEEISGSYLAGGVEYLDRTVARVRYSKPEAQEAHCSRVLMADCTFMITYNLPVSRDTVRNIVNLRKEMITYLTNNQIIKFIPPQPVLKQAEVQQEYIREPSIPTIITVPSSHAPTHTSSNNSLLDVGDLVSAGVAIGASAFLG